MKNKFIKIDKATELMNDEIAKDKKLGNSSFIDYIVYAVAFILCGIIYCLVFKSYIKTDDHTSFLDENNLYYLTSAIPQTLAGMLGVLGAVTLFKLQSLNKDIEDWLNTWDKHCSLDRYNNNRKEIEFRDAYIEYTKIAELHEQFEDVFRDYRRCKEFSELCGKYLKGRREEYTTKINAYEKQLNELEKLRDLKVDNKIDNINNNIKKNRKRSNRYGK